MTQLEIDLLISELQEMLSELGTEDEPYLRRLRRALEGQLELVEALRPFAGLDLVKHTPPLWFATAVLRARLAIANAEANLI